MIENPQSAVRAPQSAVRPQPSAWHAFGGVWRATYPSFFTPFKVILTLGLLVLYGLAMHSILRLGTGWREAIIFYVTFGVPMIAFVTAGSAIRQEMKPATVDYVFTRPNPRYLYLVFRYASQFAGIQLVCLGALAVLGTIASMRGIVGLANIFPWVALAQFLVAAAFSAFGFLCAVSTARFMFVGLMYGGLVEAALGNTPVQLNQLSMLKHGRTLIETGFREFDIYRAGSVANLTKELAVPIPYWEAIGILISFTVIALALAAFIFSLRQFTGSAKD